MDYNTRKNIQSSKGEKMRKFYIPILLILILLCNTGVFASANQHSRYDAEKFKYSNTAIQFSIVFNNNWNIYPTIAQTPENIKPLLRQIKKENFLYFGVTKNNTLGCRGLVENLNMDLDDYCKAIIEANSGSITNIKTKKTKINNIPMILWTYETLGNNFIYTEYVFKKNTYNVRLAFWTMKSLFKKYRREFNGIIKTLDINN
jgi:hypothetical protein